MEENSLSTIHSTGISYTSFFFFWLLIAIYLFLYLFEVN